MKQIAKLKDDARKHEQKEEWDKAIQAYSEVLRLGEAGDGADLDLPLYNRVGDLYVRLGRQNDAVTFYERAADKYAEVGLYNNAIALCNKALRYDANRLELFKKLGHFSASQGFYTDARRWYLEYCEKMSKRGAIDEAFAALVELANVNDAPEIRELLGRQLREHGRQQQAIVEFQRAYSLRVAAGQTKEADAVRAEIHALDPHAGLEAPARQADSPSRGSNELPGYADSQSGGSNELPGFMALEDLPPPAAEVDLGRAAAPRTEPPGGTIAFDGPTQEAAPPAAIETIDVAGNPRLEHGAHDTDFGPIDLDAGLGVAPPSTIDLELVDIGMEPALEFEPPRPEPVAPVADQFDDDAFMPDTVVVPESSFGEGLIDLDKIDFGGGLESFDTDPVALPTLDEDAGQEALTADLPALDELENEAGEPLPLVGIDDGAEFGEDETGGAPLPLAFETETKPLDNALAEIEQETLPSPEPAPAAQPQAQFYDFEFDEPPRSAPVEEVESEPEEELPLVPDGEPEPEPVAVWEEPEPIAEPEPEPLMEPEPEPEPEPQPIAAAPPPPPSPPASAAPPSRTARPKGYVDLAAFLGAQEEKQEEAAVESTRFVVAEKPPSGDEERDFAEMLEQFKAKVAETIPKEDAGSHYDLGLAYKDMGLIDEAIAEFQTALRGGEHKLKVYEELGNCFVQKQQYSVAITILHRATQAPFSDESELLGVYYNLGIAHEALGHRAEAKAAFERVISVDIGFQDTNERLAKL